ncbi:MAG: YjbH domain-containing protein [Chlamydiota bacterium]
MALSIGRCAEDSSNIFQDLLAAKYWTDYSPKKLPVIRGHYLHAGYFSMPSARMGADGTIAAGYSYVPPYRNYNLAVQVFPILEISGSYRIFDGIEDKLLGPYGFGDYADKGANFKLNLLSPNDEYSFLPYISIGMMDFLGTRKFYSSYLVATKCFKNRGFELSVGYGNGDYEGLFGGAAWSPFWDRSNRYLKGITLAAEYDNTDYAHNAHPKGRQTESPVNYGVKYCFENHWDFSYSRIRGLENAWSISYAYPWGDVDGFVAKYRDALPYAAPVNHQQLGILRPKEVMAQELGYAFKEQGLRLLRVWVYNEGEEKTLRLRIVNLSYVHEAELRTRIQSLLAALVPSDLDRVVVAIDTQGSVCQEYIFRQEDLIRYWQGKINLHELSVISPLREASSWNKSQANLLYHRYRHFAQFLAKPRLSTFFGNSAGKLKYTLGVSFGVNGYLFDELYYNIFMGKSFYDNIEGVSDIDRLNPSQIINVRSDMVNYQQKEGWILDNAYLQKNWTLGRGFYSRVAGGLFEVAYGGVAGEVLYYPINSLWAVGFEGAELRKRTYDGKKFMKKLRRLKGKKPTYQEFHCYQYFFNVYRDIPRIQCDLHFQAGRFLAGDYGVRTEVGRYFSNGMRFYLWYTHTNGHDWLNGETYYDKGVGFEMPLDVFLPYSSKNLWGTSMSAWLRDVGARAKTGLPLYKSINSERR